MENGKERTIMILKEYAVVDGPGGVKEIANAGRGDLIKWLARVGAKRGAEIGIATGDYSLYMMKTIPDLELYGVDPFEVYEGYKDYALNSTLNHLRQAAHEKLDSYPNYHFVEKYSMDAVKDFEDGSLDFVYIDANHEDPYVTDDITEWSKKVKSGGVVSGHDYARVRSIEWRYAVVDAVNRYVAKNNLQLYVWGLNSKADPSLVRDNIRSWMFIQP